MLASLISWSFSAPKQFLFTIVLLKVYLFSSQLLFAAGAKKEIPIVGQNHTGHWRLWFYK